MEGNLKKLQATVQGGGKLISHRTLVAEDASKLYIIQGSSILCYSTSTCLLISRFTTPEVVPIANAHVKSSTELLVFTADGALLQVDSSTWRILKTRRIALNNKGWASISNFTNFLYPTSTGNPYPHFLALGYPQDSALPVLYSVNTEEVRIENPIKALCWSVLPTQHSIAMSPDGRFVVAIQETSLFCKDMTNTEHCSWHSSGTRKFTCVAVHPTSEFVCATGDDSGRILIWNNVLLQRSPAKTVFHWHTLPVMDLAFTPEGSQMISGGGECTMLKWDVADVTNKRTLPRMGLPIRHISCAGNGELIAVSHADNSVQLVDPYNAVVGIVRNFTQTYIPSEEDQVMEDTPHANVFPAGVNVDPCNGCLIVNGRPGHLQCYDFKLDRHMYTLDVVHQNYVTAEREKQIPNAEVLRVAFSKSGSWMGTVEGRIIPAEKCGQATELKLKFWKMSKEKGKWVLSTCIDYPHERNVKSVRFHPVAEQIDDLICVSSGDSVFKVWGLAEVISVHGNVEHWYLDESRNYKDMPAGPVAFSSDGSLLAAAFGRSVTLWDSTSDGNCSFRFSLCHTRLTEDVTSAEFGHLTNSHLILCSSSSLVFVWDVITTCLLWVAPVKTQSLAIDPFSNIAAAVTTDLHLFFFNLDSPEPLAAHKHISKSPVISSVFAPNQKIMEKVGLRNSFVCVNSSNEVIAMAPRSVHSRKGKIIRVGGEGKQALTPFAEMVAETIVSDVGHKSAWRKKGGGGSAGQKAYSILREIMDASPHTMPSATYYCTQLLRAVSKPLTEADRFEAMEKLVGMSHLAKSQELDCERMKSEDLDVTILMENINECGHSENSCYSYNSNSSIDDCGVLAGTKIDLDEAAHGPTEWIDFILKKELQIQDKE